MTDVRRIVFVNDRNVQLVPLYLTATYYDYCCYYLADYYSNRIDRDIY